MYIYPNNLKAKSIMWLWQLSDLSVIGIGAMLSVLALTQLGWFAPIVATAAFAFLTIRFEDASILDFLKYACAFFIGRPQYFEWQVISDEPNELQKAQKSKKAAPAAARHTKAH